MAYKSREELVGKRFISVRKEGKLKLGKISEWEWRPGFVRAVSTRDSSNTDLTVLVEFDDAGWKHREYVKVHEVFQEFLVEHTLSWVKRKEPKQGQWPALGFKPVVDKAGLFQQSKRPVEFLRDRFLGTVEEKDIVHYREGDENTIPTAKEYPDIVKLVKAWTDYQDGQKILLTTPTVLLGYRVEVYRTEGTTQWYTAVIKSYNHTNKSLTLTDDTVLEEHNEDPTLIQMHLIGDGVVDSILNGVDVGVAQRRRPRSTVTKQSSKDSSSSIVSISRGTTIIQSANSNAITSQVKNSNSVTPSSSPSSPTCASSFGSGKSTITKSRVAAPDTTATSTEASQESFSEVGNLKGQQKNQKQIPKKKPDSPTKAGKKIPLGKKIKKSRSDENLESSTSVCKQTCNVLVKRIEEENKRHTQVKEKPKPPRLRDKTGQNKKPPDLGGRKDRESLAFSSLLNSSESQKESSQELRVSDRGDTNFNTPPETKVKEKEEEVKRKEKQQESANVSLKLNGKDVNPSVNVSVSEDVHEHSNSSICDTNIDWPTSNDISNSALASASQQTKEESLLGGNNRKNEDPLTTSDTLSESNKHGADIKKLASNLSRETLEKEDKGVVTNKTKSGSNNYDPKPDEDMHYKKQILRAEGNISPSQSTRVSSISEGIDVNRSLTDQLAKRNKNNDTFPLGLDGKSESETVLTDEILSSSSSLSTHNLSDWERTESNPNLTKSYDFIKDRHSAFTCVQSSLTRSNTTTPAIDDRADSRASDGQLPVYSSEDRRPGSRLDDIRSVRSSPGSSPLVVDRYEAVNPYRDPELMRKNPVQSNVQNILAAQQKMSQPSFPVVHAPVPGASVPSQTPAAFAGVPPLPARSLLSTLPSTLPYTSAHQLPPSISHHLTLSHTYPPMDVVVRAQQHQQLAAIQQQQLMGYPMGTQPPAMATLETLWQRKFPSTPLPAHWMLQKNQESLLAGDLTALRREHMHMQMEQRERERREVERRELELERLEQERREKERKDILERERLEKEKVERDKIERIERERIEKERIERERQEWEHKQKQDRVLRASVDTVAAVDQHFAESLTRLASQQGISMFPSMTGGAGRGYIPKSESHHSHPPHTLSYHDKHFEPRKEEKVKRELDPLPDDKRYMGKGGSSDKGSMYPGYPYVTSGYTPPGVSTQKPVFNLYGYPSSHSTITTEQLKQRGLLNESRQIKEEMPDKKHNYSSLPPHAMSPVHHSQAYISKEMKREPHNSVIVKRDTKVGQRMENLVAAHSHHNSSSSSSPRPQQPRPAHTPEHRPDRPLSSSASPASGIPPHLLHHSNPVPGGPAHPPPSHSTAFRCIEAHSSPRSQSPYKPAASQPQTLPQPLDFCKTSIASKQNVQEQKPTSAHAGYLTSVTQAHVSMPSSVAYSYSLIQQGLVPNPIYSQGGVTHSSGQSSQHPPQMNMSPINMKGSSPNLAHSSKPCQLSPPGSKRKSGSKDNNAYSKKKAKAEFEVSGVGQPVSIPVTTPQIVTNFSPYTTATGSTSSVFTKPGNSSMTSSGSPSLASTSLPSMNTGFMDSFKSFVENTVQTAYLQEEKKAQEKAEREKTTGPLIPSVSKFNQSPHEKKLDSNNQLACGPHIAASLTNREDIPPSNTTDSYSSRIMDTINRVANNQVDTDSDTLSASSPPPHFKPTDTNSPVNRSSSSLSSSHPHHMKKAWLQRHDEDKKSETPVPTQGEEDSNSSLSQTRDIISCVENSSATLAEHGEENPSTSPANVVVTLPNGNVSDLNHHNGESTSSASESEMQNSSKVFVPKKRAKSRKTGCGSSKKVRPDADGETQSSTPTTPSSVNNSCRKKTNTNRAKQSKIEKESKIKDELREDPMYSSSKPSRDNSPQPSKNLEKNNKAISCTTAAPSSSSPRSERSNPSPTLSEGNNVNMSPGSSSSNSSITTTTITKSNCSIVKDNKDKKKTRRNKEVSSKDGKKSSSFNKPLVKLTVASLKRTMVPFIQDGPCSEITPKLTKCRECKMTPVQRSKKQPNIFCRFYAFRRLRYNPRGIVTIHGFSELSDADPDDIEPWLPRFPVEEPELDVDNSKFIIAKVGDKFCELVEQEKEAKSWAGQDVKIVWKRAVMGVREMCDVCDTTLFNMHWVCHKCGFVVCLDCYKVRMKEGKKLLSEDKWLTCSSNRQAHKAGEMMLTQIIPSDALWELGRLIHDIRIKWSIPSNCPCGGSNVENKLASKNGINEQLLNAVSTRKLPNGFGSEEHGSKHSKSKKQQESSSLKNLDSYNPDTTSSPLSILAEVASMEPDSNRDKSDAKRKLDKSVVPGDEFLEESEKKSGCSTLRELLTKTAGKPKVTNEKKAKKGSGLSTLDDIIQSVVEKSCTDGGAPFKFLHYTPRLGGWKRELPIMVHNLTETSVLYPDVPHSWLCDGRLLRLRDAHHKGNLQIFQEQWKRGQPVLVSCANKKMNINLWKPEIFSKEFGHIENEVVNCRTGDVIIGHTMGDFWDGFENLSNRPTDDSEDPMLLKLKDWPPGDDFSELLPSRFQDLMQALPLPEYTQRNGKLNLASRLPDFLVRPDLGPKMYNAYGSSYFPKEGTTNLHLDISDAVNVMVYVGVPGDGQGGRKAQEEAAVKAIDDAGCDSITKRRVREVHEIPGALWHIYDAHDADKIRDFLNKVAKERGESIEKDHDAIHDQSWYLDKELCDRLLKEYGVQGYTIVQCLGDAIFIPAGAPHQVRNLHSCIKVAEDFVSPEHLNHCFRLTQEFRQLSETHSNHEDKLQVKNIIYHAVKDAIAVLRENDPEDE